ncbi:MAG: hypothetical protein AAFR91_11325 [Pseudomonadota bacterium]
MTKASKQHLIGMLLASLWLAGCSTARTDLVNSSDLPDYQGESVVVMTKSYHAGNKTETGFTDCVVKSVQKGGTGLNVLSGDEFVDLMYPWFEPRTVPNKIEDMPKLLRNPAIAKRMRDTGVRYVVWLDGSTERPGGGGSLSCAAGPGGAGCFGFAWWESDSDYDASVWDVEDVTEAGSVETQVTGTSYLPAIVIPIPLLARTKNTACKDLAGRLKDYIGNAG